MTHREGTIEELCNVEYGTRVVRKRDSGTIYPVYGGGGETFFLDTFNREDRVVIARFAMSEKCTRRVVGKFALNDSGLTLSPKDQGVLRQDYLDYYVLSLNDQIYQSARGTAQKNLDVPAFKHMKITYPASLEEQREIVEKLDSAFAEIDLIEGNLRTSAEIAIQLSQSLLNTSFNLNEDNTELGNAAVDNEIGTQFAPLKDLCHVFGDGDWIESKDQSESGIRLIQTGNIGQGIFKDRLDKARWITEDTFKRLRCTEIGEGDVLISRLPDPVGRACILPALEHKAITAVDCSIVRFDENRIHPRFFVYYSQSPSYELAIGPLVSGATRQRISREKLGTIQIPLPSMKKQLEILEKLDLAFAEIELLKEKIKIEKDYAQELRQSLLGSIFSKEKELA